MNPMADSFDYPPRGPFTVMLMNVPTEVETTTVKGLRKAFEWLYQRAYVHPLFSAVVDSRGVMVYCSSQRNNVFSAVSAVFSVLDTIAVTREDPSSAFDAIAFMETQVRTNWSKER